MSKDERRPVGDGPGGGEGSEPEPGPSATRHRIPGPRDRAAPQRQRVYTPEERRATIEVHEKSGLSVDEFSQTFGIGWSRSIAGSGPTANIAQVPLGTERLASSPRIRVDCRPAWWRALKHHWLFLNRLDTSSRVRQRIEFYVEEHNSRIRLEANKALRCAVGA